MKMGRIALPQSSDKPAIRDRGLVLEDTAELRNFQYLRQQGIPRENDGEKSRKSCLAFAIIPTHIPAAPS